LFDERSLIQQGGKENESFGNWGGQSQKPTQGASEGHERLTAIKGKDKLGVNVEESRNEKGRKGESGARKKKGQGF